MNKNIETDSNTRKFYSQSSDRLLQIMETLSIQNGPVRLQDLAKQLQVPPPTVLRYLNTLISQNYVYQDPDTLRYAFTWRICRLSHHVLTHTGLREIVTPYLRTLACEFGGASLTIRQNNELKYLDVIDHPLRPLSSLQRIGKSISLQNSGAGKILLSGLANLQIKQLITHSESKVSEELQKIRENGYVIDDTYEEGLRCISVPLYDFTERIVAAISVFGTINDLTDRNIHERLLPVLCDSAQRISSHLGQ